MRSFELKESEKGFEVEGKVVCIGDDLLLIITGGKAHIGAIGFAEPRKSLEDPQKRSATSSVITFLSHKDDEIAKPIAEDLSKKLNKRCVVIAGIHFDYIKNEEIELIKDISKRLSQKVIGLFGKNTET